MMRGLLSIVLLVAAPALAQTMPAGTGGYWKLAKTLPEHPAATAASCAASPAFFGKPAKGSRVLMSDRNIVWNDASATDPQPMVRTLSPDQFNEKYGGAGATADKLGLRSDAIEVIQLGAPGTLPFDTIVVKDPSTLLFERCGSFMEAVHSGGFVAPPLPR